MDKNGIVVFFRFLKENNVFGKYIRNLKYCKSKTCSISYKHNHNIKSFFNDFEIPNYAILAHSFDWDETPEGRGLWRSIDECYKDHMFKRLNGIA